MAKENMTTRARDELFSHINRCGVLQAEENDQQHWMEETVDYLAERYPDLSDGDLQELFSVGMRFCRPAIPHGRKRFGFDPREKDPESQEMAETEVPTEVSTEVPTEVPTEAPTEAPTEVPVKAPVEVPTEELVPQEAMGENTLQES